MEALEIVILMKRQELRDLLNYALYKNPVSLSVVRLISQDIAVCNYALRTVRNRRSLAKSV